MKNCSSNLEPDGEQSMVTTLWVVVPIKSSSLTIHKLSTIKLNCEFELKLLSIPPPPRHLSRYFQPLCPSRLASERFHCPPVSVWFIYSLLLLLLHYEEHVVQLVVQVAWHPIPHSIHHFHFHFAIPSIHPSIHPLPYRPVPPLLHPFACLFVIVSSCLVSQSSPLCTDLLNIIHIVDGQWFLLANKKLNVGLVCWLVYLLLFSFSFCLSYFFFFLFSFSFTFPCCRLLLW